MRFATIRLGDTLTAARIDGDRAILVQAHDAVDAYLHRDHLKEIGEVDALSAHYARVSPAPNHILCIGLNYRSHIQELVLLRIDGLLRRRPLSRHHRKTYGHPEGVWQRRRTG